MHTIKFTFTDHKNQQKALADARSLLKSTSVEVGLPSSAPVRSRWLLALHERGAPGAHIPPHPVVAPALSQESTRTAIQTGLTASCEAAAAGDPEAVIAGVQQFMAWMKAPIFLLEC